MEYERQITIVLFILIVTGVLSTPIRFISEVLLSLISVITQLPF